jgi:hypothetical protein
MELLKQELMETFDSEKDELKKKHEADLYEAEEKYETLIDRKIICFYYYFASDGYLVS